MVLFVLDTPVYKPWAALWVTDLRSANIMVMTWKFFLCNVSWKPAVCIFQRVETLAILRSQRAADSGSLPRREWGLRRCAEKERVQIVKRRFTFRLNFHRKGYCGYCQLTHGWSVTFLEKLLWKRTIPHAALPSHLRRLLDNCRYVSFVSQETIPSGRSIGHCDRIPSHTRAQLGGAPRRRGC